MFCPNCGGEFSEQEAACPYCGQLNPHGAEKKYMQDLRQIREDTGQLPEEATQEVQELAKRNGKWILLWAVLLLAGIFLVILLRSLWTAQEDRRAIREYQARAAFAEEYYPELNRLYASGQEELLVEYAEHLWEKPGSSELFSWEHYQYLDLCLNISYLRQEKEWIADHKQDLEAYTSAIYSALYITRIETDYAYMASPLTEEEKQRAEQFREEAEKYLEETLQMNAEQIDSFYESTQSQYGTMDRKRLKSAAETRLKEIGTLS